MEKFVSIGLLAGGIWWFRKKRTKDTGLKIPVKLPKPNPTNPIGSNTTGTTPKGTTTGSNLTPSAPDPISLPPSGTATAAYAYPPLEQGVVKLDSSGNVVATHLKLEYFENLGSKYIKDVATQDFYNEDNGGFTGSVEKRYFIGIGNDNYYTAAQMQSGVNVTAYAGSEIVVMAAYVSTANGYVVTWKEQLIYIPSAADNWSVSGGTYYDAYPQRPRQFAKHLRFENYVTLAGLKKPANHRIIVDTYTENERNTGTKFQAAGVSGKYATDPNYLAVAVADGWLFKPEPEGIGHPEAYKHDAAYWNNWFNNFVAVKGGLSAARQHVLNKFQERIINPNPNAKILIINNELWGYWNATFTSWVKDCYELWKTQRSGQIAAFGNRLFNFDLRKPNKSAAWADYNFSGNYAQFAAAGGQFMTAYATDSYRYALDVCSMNLYYTQPNDSGTVFSAILNAAMHQKFNLPHTLTLETWRLCETYEEFGRLGQFYYKHNGRPLQGFQKPTASPHHLRNIAATAAFFAKTFWVWDDGFAVKEGAAGFYPPFGGRWLDTNQPLESHQAVNDTSVPTSNVDAIFDGLRAVYENAAMLSQPFAFADVNTGSGWRTGADAFVTGAWQDGQPVVCYRRSGNEYLIFAYDRRNNTIKDINVRMLDSNGAATERTVRLYADRVSIVKF